MIAAPPTDAELAAWNAYVEAGSYKVAAHRLGRAESTVRNQVANVRRKLGVQINAQIPEALKANA